VFEIPVPGGLGGRDEHLHSTRAGARKEARGESSSLGVQSIVFAAPPQSKWEENLKRGAGPASVKKKTGGYITRERIRGLISFLAATGGAPR